MRLFTFTCLLVLITGFFTSCNKFAKIQKSTDYDYKLTMADEYFEKHKYQFAQQLYEELFPILKGTPKFEVLYYKYAYCFYNDGLYKEASNLFKGYLEVFPNSEKSEEIDYMRAYCFYKISPKLELEQMSTLKAIGMMQTFINTHPSSNKVSEAANIIDKLREKLELKEFRSAKLYFNIGEFRAAAIAFGNLLNNYPESKNGDEYNFMELKSYFQFAKLSVITKQEERFEKVVSEYDNFVDRFPDSKLLNEAENLKTSSINQIKSIKYEQVTSSSKR